MKTFSGIDCLRTKFNFRLKKKQKKTTKKTTKTTKNNKKKQQKQHTIFIFGNCVTSIFFKKINSSITMKQKQKLNYIFFQPFFETVQNLYDKHFSIHLMELYDNHLRCMEVNRGVRPLRRRRSTIFDIVLKLHDLYYR